jgi:sec-independent protein translocase protein TatA
MMGLGWPDLVIILFIVVIIFGAGKLPEIGGAVGRGIKEFRTATTDEMNQNDTNEIATSGEAHKDVS